MRKAILLFSIVLLTCVARSQDIDSLLTAYNRQVPLENLYLHFDNSSYAPGQTIFFKAYLLRGTELSSESKVLYLDWLDNNGNVIDRTMSPIVGFTWSGSYTIPANYSNGKLHLVAHTKWMLNFDSAFLFRQSFPIFQNERKINNAVKPNTDITLTFFPEGGNLVEGITSTLAFNAVTSQGLPISITGNIYNHNRQVVIPFTSIHNGMGKLALRPEPGETYVAEWQDEYGNLHTTELPHALKSGIVFSVNNVATGATVSVEKSNDRDPRLQNLILIGTSNQQLVFKASLDFGEKTVIRSDIPVARFPPGIIVLTVFDKNMLPLSERILFNDNRDYEVAADLHIDTINFNHRSRNRFSIQLPDNIESSLSVSITTGEGFHDTTENIISRMLLSSELKGSIYHPAFYFSNNDSAKKCLDLVMLTHGWRRFTWQDVLTGVTPPLPYAVENSYINLTGNIGKSLTDKENTATIVLIKKPKTGKDEYAFIPIAKNGNFTDSNLIFYDTLTVLYQAPSTLFINPVRVSLQGSVLPFKHPAKVSPWNDLLFYDFAKSEGYYQKIFQQQKLINELMAKTTLAEVTVHSKTKTREEELDEIYTTGVFKDAAKSIDIESDVVASAFPSVISYLQNRNPVAGLMVDMFNKTTPVTWRAGARKKDGVTAFFLDQVQIEPIEAFTIPMSDVAYVKIYSPPFSMARLNGPGGAIAIYTKKGRTLTGVKGLPAKSIEGFSTEKEFYMPTYGAYNETDKTLPDTRQTLLWMPNIVSDVTNKSINLVFYNNSISESYRVTIEGITSDGRLIHLDRYLYK